MKPAIAVMDGRTPANLAAASRLLNTPGVFLRPSDLAWGRAVAIFASGAGANADGFMEYTYLGPALVVATERTEAINADILIYTEAVFNEVVGQWVPVNSQDIRRTEVGQLGRTAVVDATRLALAVFFG